MVMHLQLVKCLFCSLPLPFSVVLVNESGALVPLRRR